MELLTSKIVLNGIGYAVIALLLFSLILGFKHFKNHSKGVQWFLIYLLVSFVLEVASSICFDYSMNNLWLINLYTILEFLFLALFFNQLIFADKTHNNRNAILIVLGCICFAVYFLWSGKFMVFSSITETIENLFILSLCIYFLIFSLGAKPNCKKDEVKLVNWITYSILVYMSLILFVWLFYEFIERSNYNNLDRLLIFSNIIFNLGYKLSILIGLLAFDYKIRRLKFLGEYA